MSPPSVWELSYWKTFHKFESFTGDWGFSLHLNFPIQNFSGLILYCFSKYWPFGNFESLFLHIDKLSHFWWILCFQVFSIFSRYILCHSSRLREMCIQFLLFYRWKLVFLPIPFVEADIIVESVVDYALYRITILN